MLAVDTTEPSRSVRGVFQARGHRFFSPSFVLKVVALRIERSATRLSAAYGQPALDYHSQTSVGRLGVEAPAFNLLAPAPKAGVLPSAPRPDFGIFPFRLLASFNNGSHPERKVGWEALESSSAVLQTAARPSQLPAQLFWARDAQRARPRNRPGVALTPGLCLFHRVGPSVISAC